MKVLYLLFIAVTVATADENCPEVVSHDCIPMQECIGKGNKTYTHHIPYLDDCHKYYKCLGYMACLLCCPRFGIGQNRLVFNPEQQVCDWPFEIPELKAKCYDIFPSTSPPITPPEPTTSPTTPPEPTTSPTTPPEPTTSPTTPPEPTTSPTTPPEPTTSPTTPPEPTTSPTTPPEPTTSPTTPSEPTTSPTTPSEPTTSPTTPSEPTTSPTTPSEPTTSPTTPSEPTTSPTTPPKPTTSPTTPPKPTTSPTTPPKPTTSPTTPPKPTSPSDDNPTHAPIVSNCPSSEVVNIQHETDCNKYYTCHDGRKSSVKVCPVGTLYNPIIGACDLKEHVRCE
uniref:salivary glue protein Sgs-3-like n=1 Tax=Bombus vancouverensis nearcticus TaxID=2705178 RepID=UPI00143BCF22|nr:salivary glue protein Sgs-3-like [Bombus vancouverensis nearcticus]